MADGEVFAAVEATRRRIAYRRFVRYALLGLAAGLVVGAAVVAARWALSADFSRLIAGAPIVAGLLAGMALGIVRRPTDREVARRLDLHFNLNERVTTALELRGSSSPLAELQRRDAFRWTRGLLLRQCVKGEVRRRHIGAAAVAAVVFAAAVAGMPAVSAAHQPARSDHGVSGHTRTGAQTKLTSIIRKVDRLREQEHPHPQALARLTADLKHLRATLSHSKSEAGGLRAISVAQAQLEQLAKNEKSLSPTATKRIAASLKAQLGQAARNISKNPGTPQSLQSLGHQLRSLAAKVPSLSARERSALSHDLHKGARTALNGSMQSQLQKSANALQKGKRGAAQSHLKRAASQANKGAAARKVKAQISGVTSKLQKLKNVVSSAKLPHRHHLTAEPGSKKKAHGASKGTGKTKGKTTGHGKSGKSNTQPPNGKTGKSGASASGKQGKSPHTGEGKKAPGQSSGKQPGQQHKKSGNGDPTGKGGVLKARHQKGGVQGSSTGSQGKESKGKSSGRGGGGGSGSNGRGAPQTAGKRARIGPQVYIRGHIGAGKSHGQGSGSLSRARRSGQVPYRRVLAQYEQSERQAIEQGRLPQSLRRYIKRYFVSIAR
jgi:hypothetical protein